MSEDDPRERPRLGRQGRPMLGQGPISRLGQLRDFEAFPGDEPPSFFQNPDSMAQQWGRRILLTVNDFIANNPNPTNVATMIQTGDLGAAHPINVQLRFAQADSNGNPILPFTPAWPVSLTTGNVLTVNVRRGNDPVAPVTIDTYQLAADATGTAGPVLPFDIVTTRSLGIDVEYDFPGGFANGVWVEAVATIVTTLSRQNQIFGWAVASQEGVLPSVASPASRVLLTAHADRQQFVITNTSTNADLILSFAPTASWGPPVIVGSIILPKNTFARYESPVGGYNGIVSGSWNNAAPDGGALVSEGTFF